MNIKRIVLAASIGVIAISTAVSAKAKKAFAGVTSLYTYDGVTVKTVFSGNCAVSPHLTTAGTGALAKINSIQAYADATHLIPVRTK